MATRRNKVVRKQILHPRRKAAGSWGLSLFKKRKPSKPESVTELYARLKREQAEKDKPRTKGRLKKAVQVGRIIVRKARKAKADYDERQDKAQTRRIAKLEKNIKEARLKNRLASERRKALHRSAAYGIYKAITSKRSRRRN